MILNNKIETKQSKGGKDRDKMGEQCEFCWHKFKSQKYLRHHQSIAKYCQKAHNRFYFRPLYLIGQLGIAIRTKDFSFIKLGSRVLRDNIRKFLR